MKFAHLRTFVAIVDNGGFARAAAQLNLTQSAASRQIGALEAELGVTLFDRIGRRVRLTSEGEDLLRHCRRALAEVESVSERARALKTGQAVGLLRVGATPQVIETLLAEFLVRYRQRRPGIEVHLIEDGGARLPNRLERGDVHLSIMAVAKGDFSGKLLYPIYVLAVLPEKHRFSRRAVLEVADLADESVVRLGPSFASHVWFDAACHVAHIRPRVLLESAAPQTLIALARTGYGIAVVPSPVRIPRDGVRIVPLVHRGVPIGRWLVVAWDPRRILAQYGEQFVTELVAHVRRGHPGSDLMRRAPPMPRPKEPVG
jgi:LysR family transcriptional regulator, cyn operon transcriptional activator